MPVDVIARGPLTDQLLEHLLDALPDWIRLGDGEPHPQAGWAGQPQASTFTASVTVKTGLAVANHRDSVRSRHASWRAAYSLKSVGAVRQQCDDTADAARQAVLTFGGLSGPLGARWALSDVVFTQLGAVNRVGNDENATYEVEDSVELWVDRQRA